VSLTKKSVIFEQPLLSTAVIRTRIRRPSGVFGIGNEALVAGPVFASAANCDPSVASMTVMRNSFDASVVLAVTVAPSMMYGSAEVPVPPYEPADTPAVSTPPAKMHG